MYIFVKNIFEKHECFEFFGSSDKILLFGPQKNPNCIIDICLLQTMNLPSDVIECTYLVYIANII